MLHSASKFLSYGQSLDTGVGLAVQLMVMWNLKFALGLTMSPRSLIFQFPLSLLPAKLNYNGHQNWHFNLSPAHQLQACWNLPSNPPTLH